MFKYDNNIKHSDFLGAHCTQKIAATNTRETDRLYRTFYLQNSKILILQNMEQYTIHKHCALSGTKGR